MDAVRQSIEIRGEVSRGDYPNDSMPFTAEGQPEPVHTVAEAMLTDQL